MPKFYLCMPLTQVQITTIKQTLIYDNLVHLIIAADNWAHARIKLRRFYVNVCVCVENIFIFHSNSMLIYLHNKPHFLTGLAARSSIIYQGTGDCCPFFISFFFFFFCPAFFCFSLPPSWLLFQLCRWRNAKYLRSQQAAATITVCNASNVRLK